MSILGLHHITLACTDAQRTLNFYTQVLGLRFIKKTVNFDDPGSYHLYFGDARGMPGSLISFFEWSHAPRGIPGIGGVQHLALQVSDYNNLLKWKRRLTDFNIRVKGPFYRTYFSTLQFNDPDGAVIEIATVGPGWTTDEPIDKLGQAYQAPATDEASPEIWPEAVPTITEPMSLQHGLHHLTVIGSNMEQIHEFWHGLLGLRLAKMTGAFNKAGARQWFWGAGPCRPGTIVAYVEHDSTLSRRARLGAGQAHHFALTVANDEVQLEWREKLLAAGLKVSPVLDHTYFKSIYTNDPDGQLVELATPGPGFAIDEEADHLGQQLKLPPWLEGHRAQIERILHPIQPP